MDKAKQKRFEYRDEVIERSEPTEKLLPEALRIMSAMGCKGWECIIMEEEIVRPELEIGDPMRYGRRLFFKREVEGPWDDDE